MPSIPEGIVTNLSRVRYNSYMMTNASSGSPVPPIDAHVHLFPPELAAMRERLLVREPWFAEAFGHPRAKMQDAPALLASMENAGVAISIAVGWPWVDQGLCREHNAYLAEVSRQSEGRIAWLGIVNPARERAIYEIERCVADGASGLGELNADGQSFDWAEPESVRDAFHLIGDLDMPVLIHTSEPLGHSYPGKGTASPPKLLSSVIAYPKVRWVMAHWGGGMPFYELMPEVRAACSNVVYDSAASTYLYDFSVFSHVARLVGSDRLLWGSDWPVLGQKRFLSRTLDAGIEEVDLPHILAVNARRVFALNDRTSEQ